MFRSLRIVLVFSMVVVYTLGMGLVGVSPAAAVTEPDTKYGSAVTFKGTQGFEFLGGQIGVTCHGQAYWVAKRSAGLIRYGMKFVAPDCTIMRPGNPPNMGDVQSVRVDGTSEAGSCTATGSTTVTRKDQGAFDSMFTANWEETSGITWLGYEDDPGDSSPVPIPGLGGVCNPTDFGHPGGWWTGDIDLGPKPTFAKVVPPSEQCQYGVPQSYETDLDDPRPHPYTYPDYEMVRINWTPGAFGHWNGRRITFVTSGTPTGLGGPMSIGAGPLAIASNGTPLSGQLKFESTNTPTFEKAIQMYRLGTYPGRAANGIAFMSQKNAGPPVVNSTTGVWEFTVGTNDPSRCVFYFGPKLWSDGAPGGLDEPQADIGIPPPDAGEPVVDVDPTTPGPDPTKPDAKCNFNIDDPASWVSGSACALVGLLGRIVSLLIGILNALIGLPLALLDLVGEMFVPDQAVMDGHMNGVKTTFQESSVGEYVDSIGGVFESIGSFNSGGCQGPNFAFSTGLTGAVSLYPMNACSSPVSVVALVIKSGLAIAVYAGGAFIALRVVGAAVGLNFNGLGRQD